MSNLIGYVLFGVIVSCFSLYLIYLKNKLNKKDKSE